MATRPKRKLKVVITTLDEVIEELGRAEEKRPIGTDDVPTQEMTSPGESGKK